MFSCAVEEDPWGDLPWDVEPHCGDGLLDEGEECDNGDKNSDELADACRTNCLNSFCGDGVTDASEDCDDGETWGGDGCNAWCAIETGSLEQEPNDSPHAAQIGEGQEVFHGSLSEFDEDCFRFSVGEWGFIGAAVLPDLEEECLSDHILRLKDLKGSTLALSFSSESPDNCAVIDTHMEVGAQYMKGDDYAICIEGLGGTAILSYSLSATIGEDSCEQDFEVAANDDLDGDELHNACDNDDDGDGYEDDVDNCPLISNSGSSPSWLTSNGGYFNRWLVSGPYTGTDAPEECEPALQSVTYFKDGEVIPAIADDIPGVPWRAAILNGQRIDFFDFLTSSAPHEAYAVTWVRFSETRDVILAMGADDGFRIWVDGVQIDSVPTCQGVSNDKYQYPMTLTTGWHRITVRVRDHGGAWGLVARFLDANTEKSIKNLELSIHPYGSWTDDQTDTDGDGIGDVCDPLPNDPDE